MNLFKDLDFPAIPSIVKLYRLGDSSLRPFTTNYIDGRFLFSNLDNRSNFVLNDLLHEFI